MQLCRLLGCITAHAAKTKPNLQLPFANANLIDASQMPVRLGRDLAIPKPIVVRCPNETAHVHPSVPRYIGTDINHSTPLAAHPHSVPDPAILFLLTLQWRLPVQLQDRRSAQ